MGTEIQTLEAKVVAVPNEAAIDVLLSSDITRLTLAERAQYCYYMAKRMGLDPLARPFDIITAGGKTFLYANRSASDQLRKVHGISLEVVERGYFGSSDPKADSGVYFVRVVATTPDGRRDEAIGAINIIGQKGEALANSIMKCETKAKRRATLSIAGLGLPDESEVETFSAPVVNVSGPRVLTPQYEKGQDSGGMPPVVAP